MITHMKSSDTDFYNIAEGLTHVLAGSYTLYFKTHYFYWNMTGPLTQSLHSVLEDQCSELAKAINKMKSHIGTLSLPADISFADLKSQNSSEEIKKNIDAMEMVQELIEEHQEFFKTITALILVALKTEKTVTAEILRQRL